MNKRCMFIMTVLCCAQLATVTVKADQAFQLQTFEKQTFLFKIKKPSFFAPQRLGEIELYHNANGFYVVQNGKPHEVGNQWVDPLLLNKKSGFLQAFLAKGYIVINQMDDGEFSLRACVRGLGGGPIIGGILYWTTKAVCYGVGAAAVGAGVMATGGALAGGGLIAGGTAAVGGGAVATAAGTATVAGVTAATGATFVGGAIATSAGATAAATTAATSTVAAAGSVSGAVAVVETASCWAYAIGSCLGPW